MQGNGHGNGHGAPPGDDNVHILPAVGLVRVDELTQLNDRLTELFAALDRNKQAHQKLHRTMRLTVVLISVYFVFVMLVLVADFYTNWWHH